MHRALIAKEHRYHRRFSESFQTVTEEFDRRSCKRMFRMTGTALLYLITHLRVGLEKTLQHRSMYRIAMIERDVRLFITLRILSGAEIVDVCDVFGIGNSTAYTILHDTVEVVNTVLRFPRLPRSEEEFRKTSRAIKISGAHSSPPIGCVGAFDDICMKLKKPKNESIPATFYCRKR